MIHYAVTQHAVDRYIERFTPQDPPAEVRRYLEWALPHSESVRVGALGREKRRLDCGAVVVTMPRAEGAVVVTVLGPPPAPPPVERVERVLVERRVLGGKGWRWWR